MPPPRAVVLTISDRSYLGLRPDSTGPEIAARLAKWGFEVDLELLPDEETQIAGRLAALADAGAATLLLTTGGTGLSPRDRTPEATARIADRTVPGIIEWIRTTTSSRNPLASLSRGLAVTRGRTLIVNLPGSPRAVREYLDLLERLLPHALEQLGQNSHWDGSTPHSRLEPRPPEDDAREDPNRGNR